MGYIGNTPAEKYITLSKQTFTPDSSTVAFTLDNPVANENELAVFVNNVRQEPGSGKAYTAGGTTLTMSEAPTSGHAMYAIYLGKTMATNTPADGSVTNAMLAGSIATAKLADGSTFATVNGITEADTWRLNTSFNVGNTTFNDLTSNLERDDSTGFGYIGTGMSQSGGYFTFPSTGIWLIMSTWVIYDNANVTWFEGFTRTTIDNASYATRVQCSATGGFYSNGSFESSTSGSCLFDVTDTSQCKLQFGYQSSDSGTNVYGGNTANVTHFQFIRLGDT